MELIPRNEIFRNHKNISNLINRFQNIFYDKEYDEENEIFDALDLKSANSDSPSFTLMINHSNINSYPTELSKKLKTLLKYLNTEKLILISHLKLDFFGNLEHDFEKVINSYSKLSDITNSRCFKESIKTRISDIDELVEIFFWLERCDASIPEYVFWTDYKDRFCFYFCKYGNIHFIDFTNGNLIQPSKLIELGFEIDKDFDQFSDDGIIENRQIKIAD